jgi:hypothetical protein
MVEQWGNILTIKNVREIRKLLPEQLPDWLNDNGIKAQENPIGGRQPANPLV